jgi:16S rRNA (cytidine1402-2'-O)-methyltransferase
VTGSLYIVSTPIGNLEDITLRALRILRECDVVACEDTRQTKKLLEHFGIHKPIVSYHEHNELERAADLTERMKKGESVALVSDAGTPLVSDPGYRLVQAAIDAGITTIPIPGASASLAALSASGLPTDSFRFCGFLPHKSSQRRKTLESLRDETATLIFYEAPHRILEALKDVEESLGPRPVVLAREVTKMHEEFLRGTAAELRAELSRRPAIKGEMTLLIGKSRGEDRESAMRVEDAVRAMEEAGVSRMEAIKTIAKQRGLNKRDVYKLIEATKART